MKTPNQLIRAAWHWIRRLVLRPSRVEAMQIENARLRHALTEVAKRGANPITEYGYGFERPWPRLADDVWQIARESLLEKGEDHRS